MTPVAIAGVDLAWGERNGDGLCLLWAEPGDGGRVEVAASAHVFGDDALFAWLETHCGRTGPALVGVDAPLVCPNATGARPADRAAQREFARFHAGPHPANASRCARPLRVAAGLREQLGFALDWDFSRSDRLALEVFPHPASVRWFGLARIVKYKRGPVTARRAEFTRLQWLLSAWLASACPEVRPSPVLTDLLTARWTKPAEDRLDALLCALVGWWHRRSGGRETEVMGDAETGFIVVPRGLHGSTDSP